MPVQIPSRNWFDNGTTFDFWAYLSEQEEFTDFNDTASLVWHEKDMTYGDWYSGENADGTKQIVHTFKPSNSLLNNGSIYLHVYISKSDHPLISPDPKRNGLHSIRVSYTKKMLNSFKVVKYRKTLNLLTGKTSATEEEIEVCNYCGNIIF